ncbi:hypothetical protein BCR33DRAFT_716135 [Rhizoclosmatium globosum]|uniref:TPR-like protein n=1 Tax=Rhizoclosmatium globosum TaxID=329046 RepID=A0A1Y2CGF4_9FUNG|nr:hypothetical protein BCR33DRAFT_716135 [Rhizoclosmatium globosum]|eukprot:ORY46143.1 hypothetical protein BCR33DRAFT_716135 [Rhizoclosmatium globosum]
MAMQVARLSDSLAEYQVDAIHMLAIAVSDQDEKVAWTAKAIALCEKSTAPETKKWLGSLYNNQGWNAHSVGEFTLAQEYFEKALVERKKTGNPETIKIAEWCIARCLRSLEQFDKALEVQERLSDADVYVCEERAILYARLEGREADAKLFAEKALAMFKEGDVPEERLAVLRGIVAA